MYSQLFEFKVPDFLKVLLGTDTITLYSYPLCIIAGSIIAVIFLKKKEKESDHYFFNINLLLLIIASAFIGGKLFLFFERPFYFINTPKHVVDLISGGYVFYGSFIVCIISIIWYLKIHNKSILKSLDIIVLSTLILHAFGRVGCFLAGCCYGKLSDFGVVFPKSYPNKVHPTQLYEVTLLAIIFLFLNYIYKRKKYDGEVFILYVLCYAIGRIIIECFRGDERGHLINNYFSHSQIIGVILIILTSIFYFKLKTKPLI
ncbi:prolipoprotein diacylglyceryl transferase [Psychroserpens luteolus]|uniref:prolipoprotein diacylglyceryl transferase n=1 Tax=Psychroserpens luteolus TaxID=2855840 RepID=UPI001E5AA498|nr:prolipoprotein diacylglyceryl transferase family protein [Psychroserpens luteolus]MCD2260428.1 prolipoprotein diacylglyceryl transferase [Psychroserpens luteolus]